MPYQPHSKQTAAGSGEAPWDTPRGGKEGEGSQSESRGEREEEKHEATSRGGGEGGGGKMTKGLLEERKLWGLRVRRWQSRVCEWFAWGLSCRKNELISPWCTVRLMFLAGKQTQQ